MGKFYVVWEGRTPGIYTTWDDCKAQVHGHFGARYKSFKTQREAAAAFSGELPLELGLALDSKTEEPPYIYPSIAVDAACSGNPGVTEYRGVDPRSKKVIFQPKPLALGTNNIGEFLALVHALAYLKKKNVILPIYTDSRTAMGWIKAKKCNTKFAETTDAQPTWELIHRAEKWLQENPVECPILKWETEDWGEIPADFGRK